MGVKVFVLCDIDFVKLTFFCQKSFFLRTNSSSWKSWNRGDWRWGLSDHHGHVKGPRSKVNKVQGGQSPVTLENSLTDSAVFKRHLFCWGLVFDVDVEGIHPGVAMPVVEEGVPHPLKKLMNCHPKFCLSASRVCQIDLSVAAGIFRERLSQV